MPCRCAWVSNDPLYAAYHDEEWGVPLTDDRRLFEFLILEGAQAGLSWITILKKRENYRRALDGFDAEKIARYDDARLAALLADPGIVRNRRKIEATVHNAGEMLRLEREHGSFRAYLRSHGSYDATVRDLRRRFKFLGESGAYHFLYVVGEKVPDHRECADEHRASRT